MEAHKTEDEELTGGRAKRCRSRRKKTMTGSNPGINRGIEQAPSPSGVAHCGGHGFAAQDAACPIALVFAAHSYWPKWPPGRIPV